MKTVTFFVCLVGSAVAIPTYPLMYKLGIRGQKNSEKINFRFMADNSQAATVSEKQHIEKALTAGQNIAVPILGDSLVASKYATFIEGQLPSNSSQLQVRDTSSEPSKKKNTESEQYMNSNDDLLSIQGISDREEQALMMDDEDKDERRTANSQERNSSEHQVKSSLGRINFLAQNMGVTLASDNQESVFERSSSHQSNREHQFKNGVKKSSTASDDRDDQENPGQGLTVGQEQDTWKYNKNPVRLFENNSEGDEVVEEEEKEEETEEWDETDYRDRWQKAHVKIQEDLYRSEQNEDSSQSDEMLRDASQPLQIIKRQGEDFEEADQKEEEEEEEEEENAPAQSHKGEEVIISPKSTEQDQNTEWQSQEDEDRFQDSTQSISDHEEVEKRLNPQKAAAYMEASNVKYDSDDNNDDNSNNDADSDEDDFNKSQKEAAYHKGERIQSNDHRSISSEEQGEGKDEDESVVTNETEDDQNVNIKHLIHFEQDYYSHEPAISDSEEHEKITSLVQRSVNTMELEDNVKMTGSSYNEDESSSDRSMKVLLNPCRNFHCKRGKVCQADEQEKLSCVCQEPAACPPTKDHEHVCGTDNKTYDGTCQLFGTKCKLEGTKTGHQLHLDYMGSCKYIPPCTDYEVDQFPLRMRDWLKNVLMQLYERDLDRSGFLSDKQRSKVKKIYQNEKRLMAGDHPVELLLQDFEKNYPMYVYPVHWQFSQLDQHPGDRLLTHSELAPLRASLVPMEHCITRFFQECDADKNKHVSLKEWCHCFGIKEEDMDENLLF